MDLPIRTRPCPYCDSVSTSVMPPRWHDHESLVTWFECAECRRMWHIERRGYMPPANMTTHLQRRATDNLKRRATDHLRRRASD
jgi:hypothetical protein